MLPMPIDPNVRPTRQTAHVLAPARESGRPFAGQAILDHQLAGEGQNEGHDRHRDRPADAVRRDHERDAPPSSAPGSRSGFTFPCCGQHRSGVGRLRHLIRLVIDAVLHMRAVPAQFLEKLDDLGDLMLAEDRELQG
jgi:hypothetical protein